MPTQALDTSIWMEPGAATKTIIRTDVAETINDKFCDKHVEYELEYTVVFGVRLLPNKKPVDACWYQTAYGLIGKSGSQTYAKVSSSSDAVARVINNDEPWVSLGATDSTAYSYSMSSFFKSIYIYDNFSARFSLNKTGVYDQYTINRSSNVWKLQYSDGSLVGINSHASSQNGEWMILEGGAGFMRLNVETKEILMFDRTMFVYGIGANPTHELAISNDGRYAIVGGGTFGTQVTYVYDLQSCLAGADKFTVATGCGKRDFKEDFFPGLTNNKAPFRYIFSGDSLSVTVNLANSTGKYDKYQVTAPGQQEHLLDYLALGDSFSSGEGEYDGETYYVKGTDGDGKGLEGWETGLDGFPYFLEKCHLSTRAYPYLLSDISGYSVKRNSSIACSGSIINDVIGPSNNEIYLGKNSQFKRYLKSIEDIRITQSNSLTNYIPGRAAQIEFIKKYKPKVVTLGIGGNDIKFGSKLEECLQVGTCSFATTLRHYTGLEIHNIYKKLVEAYSKLSEAGPSTRFYVVGYPQLLSTDNVCAPNVRLNYDERVLAREMITYLNQVIKSAAESVGFAYLDIENSLAGEQLCDESYDGKAVQGIVSGNDILKTIQFINTTFYITLGNESFHPTHIGHEMISQAIQADLGGVPILDHRPCALLDGLRCPNGNNTVPPVPSYFSADDTNLPVYVADAKVVDSIYIVDDREAISAGLPITMQQPMLSDGTELKLASNQSIQATLYSEPQNVGSISVDAEGKIHGEIVIPPDTTPGSHTLVINLKDSLYQDVAIYQPVFVYKYLDDFDGDGLPNENEKCGNLEPVNNDTDGDGIDDACDGIISEPPDTSPPTVTPILDYQPNISGWYNQPVSVSWKVEDDKDIVVVPASIVAGNEGENTYTSQQVCDSAGNCATGSVTLKIDITPPKIVGTNLSKNPKSVADSSLLSGDVDDQISGIGRGEYFIADDPGAGNGATMNINGSTISTVFGSDFGTGVYKIYVRVQDVAGNWSEVQSDYLVVYDATSGVRFRGARALDLKNNVNQLPWINSGLTVGKFAFSVRYGGDGNVTTQSDFQFSYKTGENCHKLATANNCHRFELNSTRILWLTTGGLNQSYGTFRGRGILDLDGIQQEVYFVVQGVDSERMSPLDLDKFSLTVYPSSSTDPMFSVAPTDLRRGDIKIKY